MSSQMNPRGFAVELGSSRGTHRCRTARWCATLLRYAVVWLPSIRPSLQTASSTTTAAATSRMRPRPHQSTCGTPAAYRSSPAPATSPTPRDSLMRPQVTIIYCPVPPASMLAAQTALRTGIWMEFHARWMATPTASPPWTWAHLSSPVGRPTPITCLFRAATSRRTRTGSWPPPISRPPSMRQPAGGPCWWQTAPLRSPLRSRSGPTLSFGARMERRQPLWMEV